MRLYRITYFNDDYRTSTEFQAKNKKELLLFIAGILFLLISDKDKKRYRVNLKKSIIIGKFGTLSTGEPIGRTISQGFYVRVQKGRKANIKEGILAPIEKKLME